MEADVVIAHNCNAFYTLWDVKQFVESVRILVKLFVVTPLTFVE
jgi:hypothetical protein